MNHIDVMYMSGVQRRAYAKAESLTDRVYNRDRPQSQHIMLHNDMKLYSAYEAATDSSSLSNSLKNIESWSHKWQLLINPEKSLLLQFGST